VDAVIFGVDSSDPVSSSMIALVTKAIGKPAFWGRYLTGFPFSEAETGLLAQNRIRLLPIYQGTTAHPGLLSGPVANGTSDANAALHAAKSLGVPAGKGIALYADIEGSYTASADWLSGWVAGIQGGGYVAGMYCGSDKPGITGAYAGISHDDRASLLLWSNSPCFDIANHWSVSGMPTSMGAPPMSAGGGVHVPDMWQYALPVGNDSQPVDLDVCTQRAYAAMWVPPAS
jgi:hypothetical protein